jgi:hypothetical protein
LRRIPVQFSSTGTLTMLVTYATTPLNPFRRKLGQAIDIFSIGIEKLLELSWPG